MSLSPRTDFWKGSFSPSIQRKRVTVCDFDDTVFKMHHGPIMEVVKYLEGREVYILTYRGENQVKFIIDTLTDVGVRLVGVAPVGSREKNPYLKLAMYKDIAQDYLIEEFLDDDEHVVKLFEAEGIRVTNPRDLLGR